VPRLVGDHHVAAARQDQRGARSELGELVLAARLDEPVRGTAEAQRGERRERGAQENERPPETLTVWPVT
jgi:hypothetical protein